MTFNVETQDAIIRKRLEVDERPLKRLSKRLMLLTRDSQSLETASEIATLETDFATYNQTLRRLQLLLRANGKEVQRYAEQYRATEERYSLAQSEIEVLRSDLEKARTARDDRAFFDSIAQDIDQKFPKSRKQLGQAINKLEEEVVELENERKSYNAVWQTRKGGFDDIMRKLSELQRAISGEKADAELRDAADSDEEEGAIAGGSRIEGDANTSLQADSTLQPSSRSPPQRKESAQNVDTSSTSADVMDTS